MNNPEGIVQIYPAHSHHSDVVIIGDKDALRDLSNAINEAIATGKTEVSVWASDGEGYTIRIKCVASGWDNPVWEALPTHYQADYCRGGGTQSPEQVWNDPDIKHK